jgi:hypothetical protein
MNTQAIVESWRREAVQEGFQQSLIDIYEARFGAVPEVIRTAIEDTHHEPTLRAWLKLAGTRSADEIAAAIRASRAS